MRDLCGWKNCCAVLAVGLLVTIGCGRSEEPEEEIVEIEETEAMPEEVEVLSARADLAGREGSGVSGTVTLNQEGDQVRVVARVDGVEGDGLHGFHIHENGDCSAPDFSSAGGHFNPAGTPHTCPPEAERHAGDLGNIEVSGGTGTLELSVDLITLGADANSVIGKAVILHGGQDDCESQPSGDAGDRLACGVIALAGDGMATGSVEVEGEMPNGE